MTDSELLTRISEVKRERWRGFYVDALELERDLFRDVSAYTTQRPAIPVSKILRQLRICYRELS